VGLLHYTAPSVVGGVERVIGAHADLLTEAGHHVRIVAGRGRATTPGVEFIRIPLADSIHPRIRSVRASLDAGHAPPDLDALVTDLAVALAEATADLDVLVAHNVMSLPINLPLTAALHAVAVEGRNAGPPLVAWQHDIATTAERYATSLHPGQPWDLLRDRWPGVAYVAISEARREEVVASIGIPADEVTVIPNGIDMDEALGLRPRTRAILRSMDLGPSARIFLSPVRIMPRKHLELGVSLIARLRATGMDARLVVTGPVDPHEVGVGGYVDRLLALARDEGVADAVHLLALEAGRRQTARVTLSDLYRVADALLITSHDEGFGLPILEAGAARLPVISTDIPSIREVSGSDALYLDPAGDPVELARQVTAHLEGDPVARLAARVRATYAWPLILEERIEPFLRSVAARRDG
jgi:glycosyltransferase involved in cell wall biosynthesis